MSDLSAEVSTDIRDGIAARKATLLAVRTAVRSHRPLPTIERQLDLGELGVYKAEITYDAAAPEPRAFDYPGDPGYFHITAITVNGNDVDMLPVLTAALGAETIDELADTIAAELRAAA